MKTKHRLTKEWVARRAGYPNGMGVTAKAAFNDSNRRQKKSFEASVKWKRRETAINQHWIEECNKVRSENAGLTAEVEQLELDNAALKKAADEFHGRTSLAKLNINPGFAQALRWHLSADSVEQLCELDPKDVRDGLTGEAFVILVDALREHGFALGGASPHIRPSALRKVHG